MFCYQCEQRITVDGVDACSAVRGNCGKDATTSDLQDLLLYGIEGLSAVLTNARAMGVTDIEASRFVLYGVFTTLTNVNFVDDVFVELIGACIAHRNRVLAAAPTAASPLAAANWKPQLTREALAADAFLARLNTSVDAVGEDVVGLRALVLYGIKGMAAYAYHASVLGKERDTVFADVERELAYLATEPTNADELLGHALAIGAANFGVLELLDDANVSTFGSPEPTLVRTTPVAGKAILVSGHDLHDLGELLRQTEGLGINVYTHGEMLPAHSYPELKKYPHLVGNYGGAWQKQQEEFADFPGAIYMTSNCLIRPQKEYADRIYTTGPVGWRGVQHLEFGVFGPVIDAANAAPGFTEDASAEHITIGFGREAVLAVSGAVIDAVKAGAIRHFFLIGGCDGAVPGRNYFTNVATKAPDDTVVLTLGCGKYRFNKEEFGDIGGIPRLLDVGQCNDSYSAIKIALALADAFDCGVNDLPLTLILSWFEQKAVAVLLTLLSLGVKGIHLGPTLPAFLTPPVVERLVAEFDIRATGDAESDLAGALA